MSTILRTEVAQRVFNTPLMMAEGKALAALSALGGRIVEGGVVLPEGARLVEHVAFENGRPSMARLSDNLGRRIDAQGAVPFDVVQNVAVIGVEGTLVHKGQYVGMSSGRTSYQGLQTQIRRAESNPHIAGVAFEIDSFGGEVAGAFETAEMIRRLSAAKPTIAILTDFALSAGYLLAAQARQIVMPETGRAGSIGVITLHADFSQALQKAGIAVTVLAAGKHKADGNPYEPLPEAVAKRIAAELEGARGAFAEAVAAGRGRRLDKAGALATEARDYRGGDALKLGLVDAVGSPNEAFDVFVAAVNRGRRPH